MKTKVYLKEENIFKEISISSQSKPKIDKKYLKKWEEILNLIADIIDIPSVLIMRINKNTMEVLVNNTNRENPYEVEDKEELGCGLYCETVTGKDKELAVENALENKSWKDNPDVSLNMISYYGLPIKWSDNEMFGTICVLDNETRKLTKIQKELIKKFRNVIEKDLELLISQNKLNKKEKSIKEIKNRLSLAIKGANIGVWDWNIKTGEVHFNENWANMLGYSLNELENSIKTWRRLVYKKDANRIEKDLNAHLYGNEKLYENEHRLRTKLGNLKWVRDIGKVTNRDKNGKPLRMVGVHIDIDEKKRYEEKIEHLSFHDNLTGLYNRRFFDQEMEKLKSSDKYPVTLIIGDLDKLKKVNDKYGHTLGDFYLKKSAKVLKDVVRKKDIVARIGGDEFAIILTKINKEKIEKIIKRINEEFNQINKKEELSVPLSISLGLETAENIREFEKLFEKADRKMYEDKYN